jgi:phosphotransferase system enzyme I (PtsI)
LHPAVLRLLLLIAQQAEASNIPAQICGEMASVPLYLPILIGMGFSELSMNIGIMNRAKRFISNINKEHAHKLVLEAVKLPSAEDVEKFIMNAYAKELEDEA